MTEQEKLKLAQIIAKHLCPNRKSHFNLYGDKANCYSHENFAECQTVTDTVDDLIAAGLKFDVNYSFTAAFNSVQAERERDLERRLTAAEHRAERAEKDRDTYKCALDIAEDLGELCGKKEDYIRMAKEKNNE